MLVSGSPTSNASVVIASFTAETLGVPAVSVRNVTIDGVVFDGSSRRRVLHSSRDGERERELVSARC
jgi:hypothetical protein